jgi:hypothetical protein
MNFIFNISQQKNNYSQRILLIEVTLFNNVFKLQMQYQEIKTTVHYGRQIL